MFEGEICKVKQIDRRILEELRKKLEIKIENVDIISDVEIGKVLSIIEEKKRGIFLLFHGDFTVNEQNINEKISEMNGESSFYDRIANKLILKRIEKIFNKMMSLEAQNCRLISVCTDRQFFIQKIISENIQTSFIETCINDMER